MELKLRIYMTLVKVVVLLIVPYGIETAFQSNGDTLHNHF